MAVLGSILTRAVTTLKAKVNEPNNSTKLTADIALRELASAFQSVLADVMSQSEDELALTLDYTLSDYASDALYPLPALCSSVRHVVIVNSDGQVVGAVRPLRKYDTMQLRFGYQIEGPYLRLIRPANIVGLNTLRIVYEPGGFLPLHYGTLDATNSALVDQSSGLWVCPNQATLVAGEIDYRPNAYMGAWFRIYETGSAPTGYTNSLYNIDEVQINDFTETTQRCGLVRALAYPTLAAKGGTWKYEIVPTVNWTVWKPVVLRCAREIANTWGRRSRANGLNQEYQSCMRDARLLLSTVDGADPSGGGFDRRIFNRYVW